MAAFRETFQTFCSTDPDRFPIGENKLVIFVWVEQVQFEIVVCLDSLSGDGYWVRYTATKLRAEFSCNQHGKDSFVWSSSEVQVDLKVGSSNSKIVSLFYFKL